MDRLERWAIAAVLAVAAACSDAPPREQSPVDRVRVLVGDTLAVFPARGSEDLLTRVRALALADDEKSIYIFDVGDRRIHRIDLDGNLLASMGGEGSGPGELTSPTSIQAAPGGGAWVIDTRLRRATRFDADGAVAETLSTGDHIAATFVPVDGGLLIPSGDPLRSTSLLTRVGVAGPVPLTDPATVPSLLSASDLTERLIGWLMTRLPEGQLAIVLNGGVVKGWKLSLDPSGKGVDSVTELPIPADLHQRVAEVRASVADDPELRPHPLARISMVGATLWVVSTGLGQGPLAFSIPLSEGEPELRLEADGLHSPRNGLTVRDVVVLSDRIVVARDTEIQVFAATLEQNNGGSGDLQPPSSSSQENH